MIKQWIKALVNKAPCIGDLIEQVSRQGAYPAGHYHSPIPSKDDVRAWLSSKPAITGDLPGIDLNTQQQLDLIHSFTDFYRDLPFTDQPNASNRYYFDNEWFSYSDAIFLHCVLRKYRPKRIIEVGSGYSSAVLLDTIDLFFSQRPEITFIEPYPQRLYSLLKSQDRDRTIVWEKKIQQVPINTFLALEQGDLLFIDSSHVVKCGSDLQLLMFEILPRLRPGVIVHFHDVFYPFEYPAEWLLGGRYWNENYFLRAFLSFNEAWKILLFSQYLHAMYGHLIRDKLPLCVRNPGGSLYIQRVVNGR